MNSQYGNPAYQQFGAPGFPQGIPYRQPPVQESYNGFESPGTGGHAQPASLPNKSYAAPPFGPGSQIVQNGPAERQQSHPAGMAPYTQGFEQQVRPPSVPHSTPQSIGADQLAQQVGDMHLSQDRNHPSYSLHGSVPTQRPVRPHPAQLPSVQPGFTRPPYQQVPQHPPQPVNQYRPSQPPVSAVSTPPTSYQHGLRGMPPSSQASHPFGSSIPPGQVSLADSVSSVPPNTKPYLDQHIGPPGPETGTSSSLNQVPHSINSGTLSASHQSGPSIMGQPLPPSGTLPGTHQSGPSVMGQPPPLTGTLPGTHQSALGVMGQPLPPSGTLPGTHQSVPNIMGQPPPQSGSGHFNGPISSTGQYLPQQQQPPSMQARYPPVSQPHSSADGLGPQSSYHPHYPSPSSMGANTPQNRMSTPFSGPQSVQPRRLDPDNMPGPIQVIEDDRKARSGSFCTNTRGQVPPLVTTNFTVYDEGICSPRFIRSTIYNVPTTAEMLKQTSVPFAVTISPFARLHKDETPPPINASETGPVRCNRCKAYMCPYMQFIDGGRRFQCVFCKGTTEVPPEYFAHLDHMGLRTDRYQRPELCLGSYEFVATKDYCKNGQFPNAPAFIFMIDVSYNSVRNGMVKLLCENIKQMLALLPRETSEEPSKIRVGFVTYSNVVHFYNISAALAQPQMLVVSDVQDMFMPLLDGFLVNVSEAEPVINSLMEQIPVMFADTRETETVLGPVIQAGLEALKAADCAGKLFIFHSTLPIAEAPGKLKNRDDRKLLGTDKEKTILSPQNTFYNNLGQECVSNGCCVDLFLFPNTYIDVATLGQVCRLTGGTVYKYTFFQADIDGYRFLEDLKRDISKPVAFDSILRVRTSTGIRPTDFYGNYFMSNTTDVELAAVDCDKAIAVEIKYDDKLVEEDGAFIQAAVLYTSCGGQRRLRIHNMALNTCSLMAELFRSCELDTMMNVFLKEAVRMVTEQTPRQVRDHFISRSAQILACYRKNCANPSSSGQLILPECMKLLPLYLNNLIKSDAIAGGQEVSTDDRSFVMSIANSMDVPSSACYLYPRLISLHDADVESTAIPVGIRCSIEKIKDFGVYLVENGIYMFLWIGLAVSPEWLSEVFGVQTAARIDIDKTTLLELNTPMSKRVRQIVHDIQEERQRCMKLVIVRQGDKLELLFRQLLVEDRTTESNVSYVDFLCHLHKEIRSLLT